MIATSDLRFPRSIRITKTDDYSSVFNFRKRISGKFLVIHYQQNELGWPRLGLIVPKKTTPLATRRNYMKRTLRELFRMRRELWELKGIDLVIRTQQTFTAADFNVVNQELDELVANLRLRTSKQ